MNPQKWRIVKTVLGWCIIAPAGDIAYTICTSFQGAVYVLAYLQRNEMSRATKRQGTRVQPK